MARWLDRVDGGAGSVDPAWSWQVRHPWLASLTYGIVVAIPAFALGVVLGGTAAGVALVLVPVFLVWFLGGALRLRRLRRGP